MRKARAPKNTLIYAVGDIHGQRHLLDDLLDQIVNDAEGFAADRRVLIFVGDYVDRGPRSADVIERLITGLPDNFETHCLLGNHEVILLNFLDRPETLGRWLSNGGEATLASYGVRVPDDYESPDAANHCRNAFAAALPKRHLKFLNTLDLHFSCGDYLFVHAGLRPGVKLKKQDPKDLVWIRHEFLNSSEDFGAVVVHGHTPGCKPVIKSNRIGIDTGAVINGRLTAIRLHKKKRKFLSAGP
ncbi:MAG: metallophosphoesterase family protein [Alphaproteobacteria bacterium]